LDSSKAARDPGNTQQGSQRNAKTTHYPCPVGVLRHASHSCPLLSFFLGAFRGVTANLLRWSSLVSSPVFFFFLLPPWECPCCWLHPGQRGAAMGKLRVSSWAGPRHQVPGTRWQTMRAACELCGTAENCFAFQLLVIAWLSGGILGRGVPIDIQLSGVK